METLHFAKMSGAGNDFIIIDNRNGQFFVDPVVIRQLCTRRLAVGADGLMLLTNSDQADFNMAYYNADGSQAAMCGNGGRCIARFAVLIGVAQAGKTMSFVAPSGYYEALVEGEQVDLKMIPPVKIDKNIELSLSQQTVTVDVIDTGVPHAVEIVNEVESVDVENLGHEIRYHRTFEPKGVNANFVQVMDEHSMKVRTYERGVEGETLACGTGVAASALIAAGKGLVKSPVKAETRSGVILEMTFDYTGNNLTLLRQKGEARLVYWGDLNKEAVAFKEIKF